MCAKKRVNANKRQQTPLLRPGPTLIPASGAVNHNEYPSTCFAENNEEQLFEHKTHPLLTDTILHALFAYVKPNDLRSCRLVCKKWNVLSLPVVRSTFDVIILSDDTPGNLNPNSLRITDFVKVFESNTLGFPFTKFILGSFDPTAGIGEKFIQLYGKTAKKFDLDRTMETHDVENISALLRSAPNLESFKIPWAMRSKNGEVVKLFPRPEIPVVLKYLKTLDFGHGCEVERNKICQTFFEELFRAAENICAVYTYNRYASYGNIGGHGEILKVLKIIEELGRHSSLEILSLFHIEEEQLEVFRKMVAKAKRHTHGMNLKHLSLYASCPSGTDPDPVFWFQLIELLKNSLISLHIQVSHGYHAFSTQNFPRMTKLKLLDIKFEGTSAQTNMRLDKFSQSFPALQHLRLSNIYTIFQLNKFFMGTECCPLMESLTIEKFIVTNGTFLRIVNVCPNLTELKINITEDGANILRLIWTHISKLKKLNIYGRLPAGSNLDAIITGISNEGSNGKALNSKLAELKRMTPECRRAAILKLIVEHRTLPSIADLTSLQHLTLNIFAWRGRYSRLTDWTGYLGFYSMKNLRSLNIPLCKFSKPCSNILVADMGLDSWVIQRRAKSDIIPPRWSSENERDFPSSKFSFNYTL